MPRATRRTVFRPDSPPLPPPKKSRKNQEKEKPPANAVLELFFGDPPEIFDRIVSYLDAYSLGRLRLVHPITIKFRPDHWQTLLSRREPIAPGLRELPEDPLKRFQVWTKLMQFTNDMETLNGQHFYTNAEYNCRCRGKKRKQCILPNLFREAFDNSTEELRNRYHYFVRFSYRNPADDGHRLIWQGFCVRHYRERDYPESIWLDLSDQRHRWSEMRYYLAFRLIFRRSLQQQFGQHMKARKGLHKLLSVVVIALDKTDYHRCFLVHASAGQTNLNGLQRRHSNPHRASEGFLVYPYFNFFQEDEAGAFPNLCLQIQS